MGSADIYCFVYCTLERENIEPFANYLLMHKMSFAFQTRSAEDVPGIFPVFIVCVIHTIINVHLA
jgi:hypothetical protein